MSLLHLALPGKEKPTKKKDKKKEEERNLNFPLGVRSITLAHMRE
jgi:hypothetical protein